MTDTTIAELESLFEAQKSAFLNNVYPSYEERMGWLKSLEQMMLDCRQPARDAIRNKSRHITVHLRDLTHQSRRDMSIFGGGRQKDCP